MSEQSLDVAAILRQYRAELLERTIPFYMKYAVDWKNGGLCTCLDDQGKVVSEDKYMWSQLRAVWTFSALYNRIERRKEWLDVAENIFSFVKKYGRDDKGQWKYLLAKDGTTRQGATSIYADGFAIYGFTEFARATGNPEAIQLARETYANARARLAQPGSYQTAPLPIPPGGKAHGLSMIFSSAFGELGDYLHDPEINRAAREHADQIMDIFLRPERKRLYEFMRLDNSYLQVPPGQTVCPGHAIESMWFMIHLYQRFGDQARVRQAIEAIRWHLELGWDDEFGGIYFARDAAGSVWEQVPEAKVWWVHTEAMYALLLAYSITKEAWCADWFKRVNDYAFAHFPVPQYGEWIRNLDRQGHKLDTEIALPVKDPFHLPRALILGIGVLQQLSKTA
jgi:N-acylglucosamine 2-epimerase